MPDYPDSVYRLAAEAIERELMSDHDYGTHMDSDEALARAALDAVAAELGEVCAAKITEHMEAHGPGPHVRLPKRAAVARQMRRLHFNTAAQVASRAFLTEDDLKRLAAEALAAGQFSWCPSPEGDDGAG